MAEATHPRIPKLDHAAEWTWPTFLGLLLVQLWAARAWAMFGYWVCVASAATFSTTSPSASSPMGTDLYQDMYAVERGFGWSPWTLLLVFGIPVAAVLAYFFLRIEPATLHWLFPRSTARRAA